MGTLVKLLVYLFLPMTSASVTVEILTSILNGYHKLQVGAAIKNQTFSEVGTEYISGERTHSLMRQCDKALYRAKRDGRGRLYVHNR